MILKIGADPAAIACEYFALLEMRGRVCCQVYDLDRENALLIAVKMFEKYPERVLLHGDLHHENIVRNAASENYVVIDPKGGCGSIYF